MLYDPKTQAQLPSPSGSELGDLTGALPQGWRGSVHDRGYTAADAGGALVHAVRRGRIDAARWAGYSQLRVARVVALAKALAMSVPRVLHLGRQPLSRSPRLYWCREFWPQRRRYCQRKPSRGACRPE